MGEIKINSGGGGVAIGPGAMASGAGGAIYAQQDAGDAVTLAPAQFADFLKALGELKAAMIQSGVGRQAGFPARVAQAEQDIIANDGRVGSEAMRDLLAAIRYAGCGDRAVAAAVARASAPICTRTAPVDVFVSYKREERDRVAPIVDALSDLAVDVWFDAHLQPGQSFTDRICEEIDSCAVQIVCWSPAAAASDWVRGEADLGRLRGVLIPVVVEACKLTPPFNMVHTEDLSAWRGDGRDPIWRKVLAAIGGRLGRPGLPELAALVQDGESGALARWRQTHPNDRFSRQRAP